MRATPPRVIVTRPAREAEHWVAQLRAHGLAACALPLITIGPCTAPAAQQALRQAQAQLTAYKALMFVSGNAVTQFFAFFESNRPDVLVESSSLAIKTRVWTPGPGTARALLQQGVPASLIDGPAPDAPQFDSEALWQQVAGQIRPGDRVLIVRGHSQGVPIPLHGDHSPAQGNGRGWLARQIEAVGGVAEFVPAYERSAPQLSPEQVVLAQQAAQDGSLWLLSSSEAVAHLGQALPQQPWDTARALTTHPRIAQAARAAGFGAVWECRPALSDVVASIESAP